MKIKEIIDTILNKFGYEKQKYFYYECNWYNEVCTMIDHIYKIGESTKSKTADITKQQVWLLDRKDKTIFFHRYNVIRDWKELVQWIYSEDEPKYCGNKIKLK